MLKHTVLFTIMVFFGACKNSGENDSNQAASSQPPIETASLDENTQAHPPAVISGSYLHLVCEDLSSSYKLSPLQAAVGCRFLNEDDSRFDNGLTRAKLAVHDAAGNDLPVIHATQFDRESWDDVFFIDRKHISDMVIGSEDVPVKSFNFDVKSISSMIQQLEEQRGVSGK